MTNTQRTFRPLKPTTLVNYGERRTGRNPLNGNVTNKAVAACFDRWIEFQQQNTHIWPDIQKCAAQLAGPKVDRPFSMSLIFGKIRYEGAVSEGDSFTLNNNFAALFARRLRIENTKYRDLLRVRDRSKHDKTVFLTGSVQEEWEQEEDD